MLNNIDIIQPKFADAANALIRVSVKQQCFQFVLERVNVLSASAVSVEASNHSLNLV